jgi:spermidine/putrescine transport system permease protein
MNDDARDGAIPSLRASRPPLPAWITNIVLLLPTYAWLTLAIFLPLLAMLAFSFMSATPMGNRPIEFTYRHYLAFINQPYLLGIGLNSIVIGLWTTSICAVLGFLAALALVRTTMGRSRETLLILILLPFWTNALVRIFSWTMVLRENGFLDNLFHLIVPDVGSIAILYSRYAIVLGLVHGYLPYMILTCYIALLTIDETLIEAAVSLGARWWVVLGKILLPLAVPGLMSGAVLIFIPVIGSFMEARILGGRVGVTMGTVIEDQFTQAFNWPLGASLSFTMLAVVLGILATFSGVLRRGSAT